MQSARRRSWSPEPFGPALRPVANAPRSIPQALPTYHDIRYNTLPQAAGSGGLDGL